MIHGSLTARKKVKQTKLCISSEDFTQNFRHVMERIVYRLPTTPATFHYSDLILIQYLCARLYFCCESTLGSHYDTVLVPRFRQLEFAKSLSIFPQL